MYSYICGVYLALLLILFNFIDFIFLSKIISIIVIFIFGLCFTYFGELAYRNISRKCIEIKDNMAVIITGCDSGFGYDLAIRLDRLGFKVYAGCLNENGEGAKNLQKNSRIEPFEVNVTDDKSVENAAQLLSKKIKEMKGRLHAVVNNAGVKVTAEVDFCPSDVFKTVYDVNAFGGVKITKAFLPLLKKNPGSRIVFITSIIGRLTLPGSAPYCMSKYAASSLADSLRMELKKWKISVHTIEPNFYKTPMTLNQDRNIRSDLKRLIEKNPAHVQQSYDHDYLNSFIDAQLERTKKARPAEKMTEVVDDFVDAIAGVKPKIRYMTSGVLYQMFINVALLLPYEFLDSIIIKIYSPKKIPAILQ